MPKLRRIGCTRWFYKTHKWTNEETNGDSNALFKNRLIFTEVFSKSVPLSPIVTDAHCSTIGVQRCLGTSKILQWWNHTNWIIDILALQISRFSWQITQNNESKSILKFKYGSGSWIEQNTDADFKFRFDLIFIPGPYLPVSMWCCHPSYFTMSQFCPNQHIRRFIPSQKETFSYGPALAHVAEV